MKEYREVLATEGDTATHKHYEDELNALAKEGFRILFLIPSCMRHDCPRIILEREVLGNPYR